MTIITIFSPGAKTKETPRETLIRRRCLQEENLEGPNAQCAKQRAGGGIKGVKGG